MKKKKLCFKIRRLYEKFLCLGLTAFLFGTIGALFVVGQDNDNFESSAPVLISENDSTSVQSNMN